MLRTVARGDPLSAFGVGCGGGGVRGRRAGEGVRRTERWLDEFRNLHYVSFAWPGCGVGEPPCGQAEKDQEACPDQRTESRGHKQNEGAGRPWCVMPAEAVDLKRKISVLVRRT